MFYGFDPTLVLLVPAIIIATIASSRVNSVFNRYSRIPNVRGLTGEQAARIMLDANGLRDVAIEPVRGSLTDNYDPRTKTLRLSESVCNVQSVGAVSVACHEAGHALQHAYGYKPLEIRSAIVPVVNIASKASWILIIIGIMLMSRATDSIGTTVFDIGVMAFIAVVAFHLITLPVELNASSRAVAQMQSLQIVNGEQEITGSRKVLNAAAMTYIAALMISVANLIRILVIRGRRN